MEKSCCFCEKFSAPKAVSNTWDTVLFESSNFVVVPTRGSIVKGWLLVVPKRHFPCVGAFAPDLREEFNDVRATVSSVVKAKYGSVIQFEHGPVGVGHPAGCGVDHAHLHVVGLNTDLIEHSTNNFKLPAIWEKIDTVNRTADAFAERVPYLFVENENGEQWLLKHHGIGSQMLRKVIASQRGLADYFDWKQHAFPENVTQTICDLAPRLQSIGFTDSRQLAA